MPSLIELKNVDKVYGDTIKTQVLFDINLSVQDKEFITIIGRSGSGKTTMLNILSALDRPTKGDVFSEGKKLSSLSDDDLAAFRNRTMGFIFQFHYLLPEFTAFENVVVPYYIAHGSVPASVGQKAEQLLDRVGIPQIRFGNKANNLSGGQQQRIAIARSLINNPRLVCADEPTGNLDSDTSEAVISLLKEINRDTQTAFLVVTHDRHIASQSSRIVEMSDGKIIRDTSITGMQPEKVWDDLAPCYCKLRGEYPPKAVR